MIECVVQRLIRRLAQFEAFQLIKHHPDTAKSLWNKDKIEEAEFTTIRPKRRRKRKNASTNGRNPPKVA